VRIAAFFGAGERGWSLGRHHGHLRCPALAAAGVTSPLEGPHAAPSSIPAPFFPTPFGIGTNAINPPACGRQVAAIAASHGLAEPSEVAGIPGKMWPCFPEPANGTDEANNAALPFIAGTAGRPLAAAFPAPGGLLGQPFEGWLPNAPTFSPFPRGPEAASSGLPRRRPAMSLIPRQMCASSPPVSSERFYVQVADHERGGPPQGSPFPTGFSCRQFGSRTTPCPATPPRRLVWDRNRDPAIV